MSLKLQLLTKPANLRRWDMLVQEELHPKREVTIAMAGKYTDLSDSYKSLNEALRHAGIHNHARVKIEYVDAEVLTPDNVRQLARFDAVLVPGGFGTRGLEGKILAAQYALAEKQPYLGLCLGMQMAVIAAARSGGLADATTTELDDKAPNQIIHTMAEQKGKEGTGGTMRLGDYACKLEKGSLAERCYKTQNIIERHRHRYEANNAYRDQYEAWGIRPSGINPDNNLVEVIEAIDHPFFLASQFHPEFKSRPTHPHPMFDGFIKSLLK